jgi:hypothetical protein
MTDLAFLREGLARARSVVVVLQERLPAPLLAELLRARERGVEVEALFCRFRDGDYLNTLHEAGMRLFEAALPADGPSLLFLDREEGYTLPAGAPIENAFSRVYELLWRRIAVVVEAAGRVKEVFPDDFCAEMEASRPVFVSFRELSAPPLLRKDEAIRVLGVADFLGIRGMALFLDALHIEPASTERASSAGQPGAWREETV